MEKRATAAEIDVTIRAMKALSASTSRTILMG